MVSSKSAEIRNILLDELKKDLVGPRNDEETLPIRIPPTSQYLSGILFPLETKIDPDENERLSSEISGDGNDAPYEAVEQNIGIRPSSIGLTCNVKIDTKQIIVEVKFGRYNKETSEDQNGQFWKRSQYSENYTIDLDNSSGKLSIFDDIMLNYTINKHDTHFSISIFLINNKKTDGKRTPSEQCIFQPNITLKSVNNKKSFVSNDFNSYVNNDGTLAEDLQFDLLFRNKEHFAIGHGCSVEWDNTTNKETKWIKTTIVPHHEIPVIEARERNDQPGLDMKILGEVSNIKDYDDLLKFLTDEYENWIEDKTNEIMDIDSKFHDVCKHQISKCKDALERIKNGIEIVSTNTEAGESFKFANKAMHLQLLHNVWAKNNVKSGQVEGIEPPQIPTIWRSFQIAFFLLNIESIFNPKSNYRKTADLLWFPTGGGKTEAYLGLIAFTLGLRRLRNKDHLKYGVTSLMRYTLRLLTIQQFQRASALICACEFIRRSKAEQIEQNGKMRSKWGSEPFLIGLWVGGNTTPNTLKDAEFSLNKLKNRRVKLNGSNPCQLSSCPWCGNKLSPYEYYIGGTIKQLRVTCKFKLCTFNSKEDDCGIPILVVDEDIYRRCPSLIIGTVDKFAQISWKPNTGSIFGLVKQYCQKDGFISSTDDKHPQKHNDGKKIIDLTETLHPPELIIQDELHLISGPLGTLTAMYETAIDSICSSKGIMPKIIASTATTRKSQEQIHKLFNRASEIFPPTGFNFDDSFFACKTNKKYGRLHVGICATTKSGPTILSRISAALMRKIRYLKEKNMYTKEELDPYFTFVSYFNSIRELGGANRLYEDSVPGMMGVIQRHFENRKEYEYPKLELNKVELTGRIDSSEIPEILNKLNITTFNATEKIIDVLLCTNMLSVGVDVDRLGVMLINGQPKSTSEYIQASGRIGRKFPGLIITSYNFLKPRDLSHYENFLYYHSTFHKNVEPVSITPFASRARDRALLGILVALVRLQENQLSNNASAGSFSTGNVRFENLIKNITTQIEQRVSEIDNEELDETKHHLSSLLDYWDNLASKHKESLVYRKNPHPNAAKRNSEYYLMRSPSEISNDTLSVPESLREAEQSANLWYVTNKKDEVN